PEFDGFDCFRPRDNCFPSPCLNGGQCRTLVDAYVCTCPPSYGGLDCEKVEELARVEQRIAAFCLLPPASRISVAIVTSQDLAANSRQALRVPPVNPCDSNPCRRGGTCVAGLANGDPTNYTCLCKPGFQGPHCEANINECANGGACDPRGTEVCIDGVASFTCRCLPRLHRPTVQPLHRLLPADGHAEASALFKRRRVPVDRRQPTPGAVCDCPAGYHGPALSTFDPCAAASAVCQNGGVCEIVGANRTRCICPPGTAGLRCEIDYINSCKSSASPTGESPCHGDQSECRDLPEGFRCRCQPGPVRSTCDRGVSLRLRRRRPQLPDATAAKPKAGNGVCDPDCDSLACDWTEATAPRLAPWANCTAARSGDAGGCIEPAMATASASRSASDQRCLFEWRRRLRRSDNPPLRPHEYESYCRDHFADGRCDSGCDTPAYLFDGGDCLPASSTGKLPPQPPTPPPPAGYLKLAVGGGNAQRIRGLTHGGGPAVLSAASASDSAVWFSWRRALGCRPRRRRGGVGAGFTAWACATGRDRCYTSADYAAQALAADLRLESSASSTAAGRRRPRPSLTLPLISACRRSCLLRRPTHWSAATLCSCPPLSAASACQSSPSLSGVLFRTFKSSASSASRSSSIGGGTGRNAKPAGCGARPGFQPLNSVSRHSGGALRLRHPDNECPGAAYSMQHRQHPLLLDDSFEPASRQSEASAAALQI
uniref:Notch n=1 Tax=Macrostomum lignano TaxID=282301 RepID=A0A1I8FEK3_9PLAT